MRNAFNKDIFREIRNTLGRFLGIMAIVALGVSFFSGLGTTGIDMKLTGNDYFVRQNLMDIRVISTYGMNKNDVAAIAGVSGVEMVFPTYNMDAQVTHEGRTSILKVHAIDIKLPPEEQMNKPALTAGRMPEKGNEALVEHDFLSRLGYELGDSFTLEAGKSTDIRNNLKTSTYKIVGVIQSPYYISRERGTGSIGSGQVDCYIMIPQENFRQEVFSEVFVTVKGAKDLMCFSQEYKDLIKETADAIEYISDARIDRRYTEITESAYKRLRLAEQELSDMETEYYAQMHEAGRQLAEAEHAINAARLELTGSQSLILDSQNELELNSALIYNGLREIDEAENDIISQKRQLEYSLPEIDEALNTLNLGEAELNRNEALLSLAYDAGSIEYKYAATEITAARQTIAENRLVLEENRQQAETGLRALTDALNELVIKRSALYSNLLEILHGQDELLDASLYQGGADIAAASDELDKRLVEYEHTQAETLYQISEARIQLQSTKKTLDDLEKPKWYILDRDTNPGYSSYSEDSSKIEAIGRVFPLIFFLVAALVCLTTVTRLVEERRLEIGTLKSLGYGSLKILSKYIVYALAPTLIGGAVGGYIGMSLYPALIINAYNMLYTLPEPLTPLNTFYWTIGVTMATMCTVLAAVYSCMNELRETPAGLLRPKAPKAGKRTFLENIRPLWRALTFSQKVTIRNIIRYKKRFIMTVVGIAGCTALLMTGYGIKDSVADIVNLQFGEISKYDMATVFHDSAKDSEIKNVMELLQSNENVAGSIKLRRKTMDAGVDNKFYGVTLTVPENADDIYRYMEFRNRISGDGITLTDDGVVITERLSQLLNVNTGDVIYLKESDEDRQAVTITGITENYFMHYVYMTPVLYEAIYNEKPEYNAIYTILSDAGVQTEEALGNKVLDKKGVNSVSFLRKSIENFQDTVGSLDFVIVILIISAGLLAFVVLLNLTNINISERIRELATIEVLGFYDNEVSAYIYRENTLLTIIGIAAGLLLGRFLHLYILMTVETDLTMFGRNIRPISYLYSILLTIFFSICVNLITSTKLKKIDMVEALKSVE